MFAVVGYAGSGTSKLTGQLKSLLIAQDLNVEIIKAREGLQNYAESSGEQIPEHQTKLEQVSTFQDLGDDLRSQASENAAVAAYMVRRINELRQAEKDPASIFILDSLKHPSEVRLLRHVYGENFCLIGVGCRPDIRKTRLARKLDLDLSIDSDKILLDNFIERDAEDSVHKYGQQVNDTFHISDYFVDNTPSDENENEYVLADKLRRLVELLFGGVMHRPELDERGLYHAHAASLRSSCLSRQVGASIIDKNGNLLAVGTNDVPKAKGGLYTNCNNEVDDRCFKHRKECSNTVKQLEIMSDILSRLKNEKLVDDTVSDKKFRAAIKGSRLGSLIEFSRSVHAEMDAMMSLVREGTRLPTSSSLYSTTYPCHNCARHIVAAGITRVIYLEPYAKSLAINLHDDSIADNLPSDKVNGRVQFLPYQGVSPRLYKKIFTKNAELKDKAGKMLKADEVENFSSSLLQKSYLELEEDVVSFLTEFEKDSK